ncbi:MAG: AAA family ATPase [Candidatus Omnitrophica bacterium]|nr:AAA family ATPase [Candidatus Omnitrophota bacterium]MDD5352473.1 AAA family ATPase [Candidatus Omnitrophota bacterium]MDD5550071.1 AAA family ATPase [Candidatus Omnitrophota bacterium]
MEIAAVCNQKGGTGKTTTAINLSAALAMNGKKVLLIDFDPQAHATMGLNIDNKRSIYDVLSKISKNKCRLKDIIVELDKNFYLVPSSIILSTIEQELSDEIGRECRLSDVLAEVSSEYDYILIDCPPNLGLLTINALRAANSAIIPVEASRFSVDGVARLIEIIDLICERLSHKVDYRVLVSIFDSRLRHSFDILRRIQNNFKEKVFSTIIHINVKLKESQAAGKSVLDYDKYCRGAKDYFTLSREIISGQRNIPGKQVTMEKISEEFKKVTHSKLKEFGMVTFSVSAPAAHSVFVVGDFNNWSMDEKSMLEKRDGIWIRKIPLSKGSHQYRFVVDGQWLNDPRNPHTAPNPYGELNSVVDIK